MAKAVKSQCEQAANERGRFKERICIRLTPEQVALGNAVLDRVQGFENLSHACGAGLTRAFNEIVPEDQRIRVDPFLQLVWAKKIKIERIVKAKKAPNGKGRK